MAGDQHASKTILNIDLMDTDSISFLMMDYRMLREKRNLKNLYT
jgi:hypothetical protein